MMANNKRLFNGPDFPVICNYGFQMYQNKECALTRLPYLEARSGHRIVCSDTHIYAFGGYNPHPSIPGFDTLLKRELWQYDIDSQYWLQLHCENIPLAVASSAVILDGKYLLVFGGSGYPLGSDTGNDLYVCDLEPPDKLYKFKLVPTTGDKPLPVYGHSVVKDGQYLYIIGGRITSWLHHLDVHRLDLRTNVWEALFRSISEGEEPRARYMHECALFNNKIYVFGGGVADEQIFGFKKLPAFDLETREWTLELTHGDTSLEEEEQYPSRRKCHSCIQKPENNAQVFIIGGCGFLNHDTPNPETSCWMIDLNTMIWKKISSLELQYGTYFHSSTVTPSGKLYTHGGIILKNGHEEYTKSMFEAWIQVPSLKEMCKEAVLHFVPVPIDYLKQLPIPAELKKRLLDVLGISDEPPNLAEMKKRLVDYLEFRFYSRRENSSK